MISKSERKSIFLDLKPLFAEIETMYFGTQANFALTQTLGLADVGEHDDPQKCEQPAGRRGRALPSRFTRRRRVRFCSS